MSEAIQITAIGMTLVFGGILLLWGLMALIMWLFPYEAEAASPQDAPDEDDEQALKIQAAALAVAVALAKQHRAQVFPLREPAIVSAWQAARRASQFRQRKQWK